MSAPFTDREFTPGSGPSSDPDDRPFAASKVLGSHLRELRRRQGLKIKDVAPRIRASVSKISRLERGESPPRERDVRDLLSFYQVRDRHEFQAIMELLQQAAGSAWWHQYSDVTPGWLRRLVGLEDSASHIRTYEVHLVPGLLQTPGYAEAVVRAGLPDVSEEEIQRRVELRMARQELLASANRPLFRALLDESILLRPVGGVEVMREQLEYLRHMDEQPNISIRVVRFGKGALRGPGFPVTYLRFTAGGPPDLVYLEQINSALYVDRQGEIESYRHVLDELDAVAEGRRDSRELLAKAARSLST
jgi:transcriptional regulator with XRE-family HTH domain